MVEGAESHLAPALALPAPVPPRWMTRILEFEVRVQVQENPGGEHRWLIEVLDYPI